MTIISHEITEIQIQLDGKKRLRIIFTDHDGEKHTRNFRNRDADLDVEIYALSFYFGLGERLKDREEQFAIQNVCEGNDSLTIINSANHSTKQDLLIVLLKQMMKTTDFKTMECMQSVIEDMRLNYTDAEIKSFLSIDDAMYTKLNDKYDTFMTGKVAARTALDIVEEI